MDCQAIVQADCAERAVQALLAALEENRAGLAGRVDGKGETSIGAPYAGSPVAAEDAVGNQALAQLTAPILSFPPGLIQAVQASILIAALAAVWEQGAGLASTIAGQEVGEIDA